MEASAMISDFRRGADLLKRGSFIDYEQVQAVFS